MQQICVQQYVLMSTEMYQFVLFMVNALKKNAQYVLCVPLMLVLQLLVKYTHLTRLCYLRRLYQTFTRNTTIKL